MIVYGINPVLEALRAGRVRALRVTSRQDARVEEVLRLAAAQGVRARRVEADTLARETREGVHQGVVAEIDAPKAGSVEALVRAAARPALIVVLDGVEDPHNVGAIIRSVDAAGGHGVIRQTRRAAPLEAAAAKASAGAIAWVPVAEVVNVARAVEELKEAGVWTVGLAAGAETAYHDLDLTVPTALVLGAEGAGLRRLVRERCDFLARIPLLGHVDSLNVSVAAGIVLFEAARQRQSAR